MPLAAVLATAPGAAALPAGAFGWMAELAGHCWTATFPDGARDTQCYQTQYDRYLRGTIEIVAGNPGARPPYRGDSVFFWNPARSEMEMHYWSDAGAHGVMTGRIEGAQIVFTGAPRAGTPETRTVLTRVDADSFRAVQQRRNGNVWSDGPSLTYTRSR
jgi:hypothetical protein